MNTTLANSKALSRPVISTWIVLDSAEDETDFPSAGSRSSTRSFQWIYWRCTVVFFATSLKQNPESHHVLFCNTPFDQIQEQDTIHLLRQWNVELVHFPLTYRMPKGSVTQFGNVFYELDVLKYAAQQPWAGIILLDSDCVWVKSVEPINTLLSQEPLLSYTLLPEDQKNYQGDVLINGTSRKKMIALVQEISGVLLDRDIHFAGGEFLAATKAGCQALVRYFDPLWKITVDQAMERDSVKTEESFLTILFEAEHARPFAANPFIRRLWTHFADFNVKESDLALTIWHVPAEKQFGYKSLHAELVRSPAEFWAMTPEESVLLLRRHLGIPRRSRLKLIVDVAKKITTRLQAKVAHLTTKSVATPNAPHAGA